VLGEPMQEHDAPHALALLPARHDGPHSSTPKGTEKFPPPHARS